MHTIDIVSKLIRIANICDERDLTEEADSLTAVAQKLAQTYTPQGALEDYDAAGSEFEPELGEARFLADEEMKKQLAEFEYEQAMKTVQELMPRFTELSPEEQDRLKEAEDFLGSRDSVSDRLDPQSFAQALEEAGAQLQNTEQLEGDDPFFDE